MFDRFRSNLNPEAGVAVDPESQSQQNLTSDADELSGLSYETRIYCFAGCFFLSLFCSILGSPLLVTGKLTGFAVMVSLGSILSICGTFFLSGPKNQLRKMVDRTRLVATLVYLLMIVLTLVAGLVLHNSLLAIIFIIGQYLAMAWYSISFIPYARQMVGGCLSKICG